MFDHGKRKGGQALSRKEYLQYVLYPKGKVTPNKIDHSWSKYKEIGQMKDNINIYYIDDNFIC